MQIKIIDSPSIRGESLSSSTGIHSDSILSRSLNLLPQQSNDHYGRNNALNKGNNISNGNSSLSSDFGSSLTIGGVGVGGHLDSNDNVESHLGRVDVLNSNNLTVYNDDSDVSQEAKLFVGMLPKTVGEEQLRNMFSKFGIIKEVHIIRGPDGNSKGCAFIRFVDYEGASLAIDQLHETIPICSTRPLVVKFADRQNKKKIGLRN